MPTCATKWCFSHSGTNARQAICERHSTPKLRDPVQRLCAPTVLTDPTKSQRPASCFTTRAKSHQHEYKGHVVLLGVRSPSALASPKSATPFLFNHGSPKCASPSSFDNAKNNPPPPGLSGFRPAHTKPRKAGLLTSCPSIISLGAVTLHVVTL